jgi:putative ABC transport system permease protein
MSPRSPSSELTRALLRAVLTPDQVERAESDLHELSRRVAAERGERAARRAWIREVVSILLWSMVDRIRQRLEHRSAGSSMRRYGVLRGMGQDLRFAARVLARRPGFTVIATIVLGLGLGANVAIFTLTDRLFLRPPPGVHNPDALVRVFRSWAPGQGGSLSYPDYLDYRSNAKTLTDLAGYGSSVLAATARLKNAPLPVNVLTVTANYFDVIGLKPVVGRFFLPPENEAPDTHPVAVVSWAFWNGRMKREAAAVGREILVNGHRFTVIGVSSREYRGLSPAEKRIDVYIPIMMRNAVEPQSGTAWRERVPNEHERWIAVLGRLRAGMSVEAVQAELAGSAKRINTLTANDSKETVLVSRQFRWYPGTRTGLVSLTRILLISVALLLAIATANVAILLLARASTRTREVGVRAALGAGRARLARQLLTETLLLGCAGCALGVALSVVAARTAGALLPVQLEEAIVPDTRTLLFAISISLATAALAGLWPALRGARSDVAGLIHGRDRHAGGTWVRDALVVTQVALSVVLVAASVLFGRSFLAARSVDVGFDDRGVLLVGVNLRNHGYDAERGRVFVRNALAQLSALPGVQLATVTRMVPFQGDWTSTLGAWPGAAFTGGLTEMDVGMNVVGTRYFEGLGIPLLRGRDFHAADDVTSAPVIVVNETFARKAFGQTNVLGRVVPLRGPDAPAFTVIGVVRDAMYYALNEDPFPQVYGTLQQYYVPDVSFLLKTSGNPEALVRPAQNALHALDPDVAFTATETLASVHAEQFARFRATAHVVSFTGLIALLLASAGLYGVMAFRVAQRTREIGLRLAFGATRKTVGRDVLSRGLRLVAIGGVLGIAVTLALGQLVERLLFGVRPDDPFSLMVAPVVLFVVAMLAMVVPARRAMRVDPMIAIRTEL